jgi:hypothetical protein
MVSGNSNRGLASYTKNSSAYHMIGVFLVNNKLYFDFTVLLVLGTSQIHIFIFFRIISTKKLNQVLVMPIRFFPRFIFDILTNQFSILDRILKCNLPTLSFPIWIPKHLQKQDCVNASCFSMLFVVVMEFIGFVENGGDFFRWEK